MHLNQGVNKMNLSENDLEKIIDAISDNEEVINSLKGEQIDYLINYLQSKIKEKENILEQLKKNVEN